MAAPEPRPPRELAAAALSDSSEAPSRQAIAWALIAVADELAQLRREVRHGRVSGERQARRG